MLPLSEPVLEQPPTPEDPSEQTPPPDVTDEEMKAQPSPAGRTGFWPVLRNPNFLALWLAEIFSQMADKIYLVLMIALISSRFQVEGQPISGWVSAIMIAYTIPAVLFGSLAGVWVDRGPLKQVLIWSNVIRGGMVLAIPLLLYLTDGQTWLFGQPVGFQILLGITFLVSTLNQFFSPAEQVVIPLIVRRSHLLAANSIYTTTTMGATIVGFAVGEPLLRLADTLLEQVGVGEGKEILVGLFYVLSGVVFIRLRLRPRDRSHMSDRHLWADVLDGLHYLQKQPLVRAAMVQLVILFSVFAALAVLAVRLAELIPALGADQFGILLSVAGLGMGIGALLVGQFGQRFSRQRLALIGSIGMAIMLAILACLEPSMTGSMVCITTLGIFAAALGIPMQTVIQEKTPTDMRGKVFGLQNNAINIALSLPLAVAGLAESWLGLTATLLGLSAIVLLGSWLSHNRAG